MVRGAPLNRRGDADRAVIATVKRAMLEDLQRRFFIFPFKVSFEATATSPDALFHPLDGLEPEDRGMVYAKVRQYLNAIAEPAAATCGYSSASAESSREPPAKKPA